MCFIIGAAAAAYPLWQYMPFRRVPISLGDVLQRAGQHTRGGTSFYSVMLTSCFRSIPDLLLNILRQSSPACFFFAFFYRLALYREGTGWLEQMLIKMEKGEADTREIPMLEEISRAIEGHTICALGDAAAWPVQVRFFSFFFFCLNSKIFLSAGK